MYQKRLTMRYFMLSFAAGFLILSVTAMLVVLFLPPQMSARQEDKARNAPAAGYLPTGADSRNLLFILSSQGTGEMPGSETFVLIRFDPMRGAIPAAALPSGLPLEMGSAGTQSLSLGRVYRSSGVRPAAERLAKALGVPIHGTARLTRQNIIDLVDVLGGVNYTLPSPVAFQGESMRVELPAQRQLLSGSLFYNLLSYTGYEGGEAARCALTAELCVALINEHFPMLLGPEADTVFQRFVNMAETDISAAEYERLKPAAQFLARLETAPAKVVAVEGSLRGSDYLLTQNSQRLLQETFSQTAEHT